MAEHRTKTASILLDIGRKARIALDLFPAEQWPGKAGSAPGLFRVRVDGKWHSPSGKYTFLPLPAVLALAGRLLAGGLGRGRAGIAEAEPSRPPKMPRRTPVRVANGKVLPDGTRLRDLTRTASDPILAHDGRWMVAVLMPGRGFVHVPCADCEPVKARGKAPDIPAGTRPQWLKEDGL